MQAGTGRVLRDAVAVEATLALAPLGEVDLSLAVMDRVYADAVVPRRGRDVVVSRMKE